MTELITSSRNPIVKKIRSLYQRKGRDETGLFLAEGIHPVGEAVDAGWEIETLVYAPDLLSSNFAKQLVNERIKHKAHCVVMTASLFSAIAEKENPQGILAIIRQRPMLIEEMKAEGLLLGVALLSPQDPGNVGTILRTMDAVGADGLFLLEGGVDPHHPSAVRASMGTIFWKPVVSGSFRSFISWARKNDYLLVGSSAHANTDYRAFRREGRRMILLLGNEQKGLSQEQMAECNVVLSLPMKGRSSSLNLAVAAGVFLYSLEV